MSAGPGETAKMLVEQVRKYKWVIAGSGGVYRWASWHRKGELAWMEGQMLRRHVCMSILLYSCQMTHTHTHTHVHIQYRNCSCNFDPVHVSAENCCISCDAHDYGCRVGHAGGVPRHAWLEGWIHRCSIHSGFRLRCHEDARGKHLI